MSFSSDGMWLVTVAAAPERSVAVWDVATGEAVAVGSAPVSQTAVAWQQEQHLPSFYTIGQVTAGIAL